MRRLFLISSYCDTEEKTEVLKKNLIRIKDLGWDTMLLSPIGLESSITVFSTFLAFVPTFSIIPIVRPNYRIDNPIRY